MIRRALTLSIFCALACPSIALAVAGDCSNANDGTPCSQGCVALGTCTNHKCVPGMLRPDGSPCSSNNPCTMNDQCMGGLCIPGGPIICPTKDACNIGICDPTTGCGFTNICPPDLAGQTDDAGVPDGGAPDLLGLDLCTVPPGSEFFSCDNPPDGFWMGDGPPPDGFYATLHVRGSRVGDCSFGGGELGASLAVLLLFTSVVFATRRRQSA
jgi:hypothetical protein